MGNKKKKIPPCVTGGCPAARNGARGQYCLQSARQPNIFSMRAQKKAATEDKGPNSELIVTIHPELAKLTHETKCTQHNNTYVRIGGPHNEWEVAIWDDRLNRRKNFISLETYE